MVSKPFKALVVIGIMMIGVTASAGSCQKANQFLKNKLAELYPQIASFNLVASNWDQHDPYFFMATYRDVGSGTEMAIVGKYAMEWKSCFVDVITHEIAGKIETPEAICGSVEDHEYKGECSLEKTACTLGGERSGEVFLSSRYFARISGNNSAGAYGHGMSGGTCLVSDFWDRVK